LAPQPSTISADSSRPRLRPIALPVEHGGWGFTLEPVLLGLLVAPSWTGAALGLFALAAFLTRHPLKLWLRDAVARRRYPRTRYARRFVLLYAGTAAAALGFAMRAPRGPFWEPLLLAAPLALVQFGFDLRDQARNLVAEMAGAFAMGAPAPAIALAASIDPQAAYGLWLILAARGVAAIAYARVQVRRARGKGEPPRFAPAWLAMALSAAILFTAAWRGWVPWLGALSVASLLPLAAVTFHRPPAPAKVVGWTQIAFGVLVVVATAAGVRAGW
jgi:hypothetical protein